MFQIVPYTVKTNKQLGAVSPPDASLRFALISDLHSQRWGIHQELLLDALEREAPDALLMSGDIFHHAPPYDGSRLFVEEAAKRFPCYYVSGNHENKSRVEGEFKPLLRECGVRVLEGECEVFEARGMKVNLCGVDEPKRIGQPAMLEQLAQARAAADPSRFTVLLAHRPELIGEYLAQGFDLILCGHAHGGQWRLPGLINGLYAPGQGIFPKYAGGRYDFGNTVMIVGRGLTNATYGIPRIFNPPELPIITICN